jgi:hypothetical protein
MHGIDPGDVSDFLKAVIPLVIAVMAHFRADKALRKARAVEAACTYPACGHTCSHAVTH